MRVVIALLMIILLAGATNGIISGSSSMADQTSVNLLLKDKRQQLVKVKNSMVEMELLEKAAKNVVPSTSDFSSLISEYTETKTSLQNIADRLDKEIYALETLNCQTIGVCQKSQVNGTKSIGNSIKTGATLKDVDVLISSNGRYTLRIKDATLVILDTAYEIKLRTFGQSASRLDIQADGNVVLRDAKGSDKWNIAYTGKEGPYTLILENNGDLVYYDKNEVMIWHSRSENGNFIWESLSVKRANDLLTSLNGRFMFKVKEDGDCVLSDRSTGKKLWSTGTKGVGNTFLVPCNADLSVYNRNNELLWHIVFELYGKMSQPYRLTLSDEGVLTLNDRNNAIIWQRNTTNKL